MSFTRLSSASDTQRPEEVKVTLLSTVGDLSRRAIDEIRRAALETWAFFLRGAPLTIRLPIFMAMTGYSTIKQLYSLLRPLPLPVVEEIDPAFMEALRKLMEENFSKWSMMLKLPATLDNGIKRIVVDRLIDQFATKALVKLPLELKRKLTPDRIEGLDSLDKVCEMMKNLGRDSTQDLFTYLLEELFTVLPPTVRSTLRAQGIEVSPYQKVAIEIDKDAQGCSITLSFSEAPFAQEAILATQSKIYQRYRFENVDPDKLDQTFYRFVKLIQEGDATNEIYLSGEKALEFLSNHFSQEPKREVVNHTTQFDLYEANPTLELWHRHLTKELFHNDYSQSGLFLFEMEFFRFLHTFAQLDLKEADLSEVENEVARFESLLKNYTDANICEIQSKDVKKIRATFGDIRQRIAQAREPDPVEETVEQKKPALKCAIPPMIAEGLTSLLDHLGNDRAQVEALLRGAEMVLGKESTHFLETIQAEYQQASGRRSLPPLSTTSFVDKSLAVMLTCFTSYALTMGFAPLLELSPLQIGLLQTALSHPAGSFFATTLFTSTILTMMPARYHEAYHELSNEVTLAVVPYLIYYFVQMSLLMEKAGLYALIERSEKLAPLTKGVIKQERIEEAKRAIESLERTISRSLPLDFDFTDANNKEKKGTAEHQMESRVLKEFALVAQARENLEQLVASIPEPLSTPASKSTPKTFEDSFLHELIKLPEQESAEYFDTLPAWGPYDGSFESYAKALDKSVELYGGERAETVRALLKQFAKSGATGLSEAALQRVRTKEETHELFLLNHRTASFSHRKVIACLSVLFPNLSLDKLLSPSQEQSTQSVQSPQTPLYSLPPRTRSTRRVANTTQPVATKPASKPLPIVEEAKKVKSEIFYDAQSSLDLEKEQELVTQFGEEKKAQFDRLRVDGLTLTDWYVTLRLASDLDAFEQHYCKLQDLSLSIPPVETKADLFHFFEERLPFLKAVGEISAYARDKNDALSKGQSKQFDQYYHSHITAAFRTLPLFDESEAIHPLWQEIAQDEAERQEMVFHLLNFLDTLHGKTPTSSAKLDSAVVFTLFSHLFKEDATYDVLGKLSDKIVDTSLGKVFFSAYDWDLNPLKKILQPKAFSAESLRFTQPDRELMKGLNRYWERATKERASNYEEVMKEAVCPSLEVKAIPSCTRLPLVIGRDWRLRRHSYLSKKDPRYALAKEFYDRDPQLQACLEYLFPGDLDRQLLYLYDDSGEILIYLRELAESEDQTAKAFLEWAEARPSLLPFSFSAMRRAHLHCSQHESAKELPPSQLTETNRDATQPIYSLEAARTRPLYQLLLGSKQFHRLPMEFQYLRPESWNTEAFAQLEIPSDIQDKVAQDHFLHGMMGRNPTQQLRRFMSLLHQDGKVFDRGDLTLSSVADLFSPTSKIFEALESTTYEEYAHYFEILERYIQRHTYHHEIHPNTSPSSYHALLLSQILKGFAIRRFPDHRDEIHASGYTFTRWEANLERLYKQDDITLHAYAQELWLMQAVSYIFLDPEQLPDHLRDEALVTLSLLPGLVTTTHRLPSLLAHFKASASLIAAWHKVTRRALRTDPSLCRPVAELSQRLYRIEGEPLTECRWSGGAYPILSPIHQDDDQQAVDLFSFTSIYASRGINHLQEPEQQEAAPSPTPTKCIDGRVYTFIREIEEHTIFFSPPTETHPAECLVFASKSDPLPSDRLALNPKEGSEDLALLSRAHFIKGKAMVALSDEETEALPQKKTLSWFAEKVTFYRPLTRPSDHPTHFVLERKGASYSFTIRENKAYYDNNPALFLSRDQEAPTYDNYGNFLRLEDAKGKTYLLIDFFSFPVLAGGGLASDRGQNYYSRYLPSLIDSQITFENEKERTGAVVLPINEEGFELRQLDFRSTIKLAVHAYFSGDQLAATRYLLWAKQLQNIHPISTEERELLFYFILFNFSLFRDEDTPFFLSLFSIYFQNPQLFTIQGESQHADLQEGMLSAYALVLYYKYIEDGVVDSRLLSPQDELMLFEQAGKRFANFVTNEKSAKILSNFPQFLLQTAIECLFSKKAVERIDTLIAEHDSGGVVSDFLGSLKRRLIKADWSDPLQHTSLAEMANKGFEKAGLQAHIDVDAMQRPPYPKSTIALKALMRLIAKEGIPRLSNRFFLETSLLDQMIEGQLDLAINISPHTLNKRPLQTHFLTLAALAAFDGYDQIKEEATEKECAHFLAQRSALQEALQAWEHYPAHPEMALLQMVRDLMKREENETDASHLKACRSELNEIIQQGENFALKELTHLKQGVTRYASPQKRAPWKAYMQAGLDEVRALLNPEDATLNQLNGPPAVKIPDRIPLPNWLNKLHRWRCYGLPIATATLETVRASLLTGVAETTREVSETIRQPQSLFKALDEQDALCAEQLHGLVETHFDTEAKSASHPSFEEVVCETERVADQIEAANACTKREEAKRAARKTTTYQLKEGEKTWNTFVSELSALRRGVKQQLQEMEAGIVGAARVKDKHVRFQQLVEHFLDHDHGKLCSTLKIPDRTFTALLGNTLNKRFGRACVDQCNQSTFATHIYQQLYFYFLLKNYEQRLGSALALAKEGSTKASKIAGQLSAKRHYTFSQKVDHVPDAQRLLRGFLLFEAQTGVVLREKQVEQTIKVVAAATRGKRVCGQYIMGMGKTFFYDTWNLFLKWKKGMIPVLVIPDHLIDSMKDFLGKQFYSVFGKQLHYIPIDRHTCQPRRLKQILHTLNKCRENGDALLFGRDGIPALQAMLSTLLYEQMMGDTTTYTDEQVTLLRKILFHLKKDGHITGDEAHKLFDRKVELNFPVGKKRHLPADEYRLMGDFMRGYFLHLHQGSTDVRQLPKRGKALTKEEKTALANFCTSQLWLKVTPDQQQLVVDYLLGDTESIPPYVESHPHANELYLLRGLLGPLFGHVMQQRRAVDWGPSKDVKPAIPYSGSNAPEEGSYFKLPYITALLSYRKYFQDGLTQDETEELRSFLQERIKNEKKESGITEAETYVIKKLQEYLGGSRRQLQDYKNEEFAHHFHMVAYFVANIVSKEITYYPYNATCNAQNFGSAVNSFDVVTGTPDTYTTFPIGTETVFDDETVGKTLLILREKLNAQTSHIVTLDSQNSDTLSALIERCANPQVRAVMDEAAIFQDTLKLSNLQAATRLMNYCKEERPEVEAVAYYDEQQTRQVLQKGGRIIPFEEDNTPPNKRLVLYDQAHCVGADFPHAYDTMGLLTVGLHSTWSSFSQALWRLRGLEGGQNVEIVITPALQRYMEKHGLSSTLDGILNYLYHHADKELKEDNFGADGQKITNALSSALRSEIYRAGSNREAVALFKRHLNHLLTPGLASTRSLFGEIEEDQNPYPIMEHKKQVAKERLQKLPISDRAAVEQGIDSIGNNSYPKSVRSSLDLNLGATMRMQVEVDQNEEEQAETTEQAMTTVQLPKERTHQLPAQKWSLPENPTAQGEWATPISLAAGRLTQRKALHQEGVPVFSLKEIFAHSGNADLKALAPSLPPGMYATGNLFPALQTNRLSMTSRYFDLAYWKKPAFQLVVSAFKDKNGRTRFQTFGIDQFDFGQWKQKLDKDEEWIAIYDLEMDSFVLGDTDSPVMQAIKENQNFSDQVAIWTLLNCPKRVLPVQEQRVKKYIEKLELPDEWDRALEEVTKQRSYHQGSSVGQRLLWTIRDTASHSHVPL